MCKNNVPINLEHIFDKICIALIFIFSLGIIPIAISPLLLLNVISNSDINSRKVTIRMLIQTTLVFCSSLIYLLCAIYLMRRF